MVVLQLSQKADPHI